MWIGRSRSGGPVGRALRASPLLAFEAGSALGGVGLWPAVDALAQTELVDAGTLEAAAWLAAAVAGAFCGAVAARSGRALLRRVDAGGAGE